MDFFRRQQGVLHSEGIPLTDIAKNFGTPTYVYSKATLVRHVAVLKQGVASLGDPLLCYAVKANGNLAILQLLHALGCGFDAVSLGELYRVLKAGGVAARTIVSGVGKSNEEIAAALQARVLYIGVESAEELQAVAQSAATLQIQAPVAIRVNPDVDAKTHPYISTGLKENKFGVPMADAAALYQWGQQTKSLKMVGVTCHIGSQITTLDPFIDAAQRLAMLAMDLKQAGIHLQHLGMGGGLGVPYQEETPPDPKAYGVALAKVLKPLGLQIIFEPGRVIVGNAAVLLTRVVRCKPGTDRNFVLIDAGMNDLLRPALYNAYHHIEPVEAVTGPPIPVDVVGPVCESADTFARQRLLPALKAGDLLAIRTAGAYGFAMASTYNGRRRPAEVLCDGENAILIRQRDNYADLWRGEHKLEGLPADTTLPNLAGPLT